MNAFNLGDPLLQGPSEILAIDGPNINITLRPKQRWSLLFIYDTSIELSLASGKEIESPVRAIVQPMAMRDLSGNTLRDGVAYLNISDTGGSYVYRAVNSVLSDVGEGHVATYGYEKRFIFNGSGISMGLVRDRAKWVPGHFTQHKQCGEFDNRNASGMPAGEGVEDGVIHVNPGGNRLSFSAPSPPGEPYKLCYRFSDEPYKLFQTVRLTVKQVIGLKVLPGLQGSPTRAVVDKPKGFVLQGCGIEPKDSVRFVPFGRTSNDDCSTSLPLNKGGLDGDFVSGLNAVFTTIFVTPSDLGKPHMLCMKFGKEPWALVKPPIFVEAALVSSTPFCSWINCTSVNS